MPHFFVPPSSVKGDAFVLAADESRHVATVLRKRPGDEIPLFDGTGAVYVGRLESVEPGRVAGRIVSREARPESPLRLRLFQGLPKGDKLEWIIEKMTELGAWEIVPLEVERCVAKVPRAKLPDKLARWGKIALAAAKQAGRTSVPQVRAPMNLTDALALSRKDGALTLFPWEAEKALGLKDALRGKLKPGALVDVFIGPEGGFAPREAEAARAAGAALVSLGPWILRTETAGLFTASALIYESTGGGNE